MTDSFADIRPYKDDEVATVLTRLLGNPEFLDTLGAYRLGGWAKACPALVRPLVRFALRREVRFVSDVRGMQTVIEGYMARMIESTTGGLTVSGLESLEPGEAHLFISNHRDIAMDPAFTITCCTAGGARPSALRSVTICSLRRGCRI